MSKIDQISEWSGKLVSFLIFLLMFSVTYEVAMRYLFRAPTIWSYDVSYMLGGSLMVLGGAYVLLHKSHIRVDIVYSHFSIKWQTFIDIVFTLLLFLPMMIVLFQAAIHHAWTAWVIDERSSVGTAWYPPLSPFRTVVPVAIFLILLQGVSWFVGNVRSIMKGSEKL